MPPDQPSNFNPLLLFLYIMYYYLIIYIYSPIFSLLIISVSLEIAETSLRGRYLEVKFNLVILKKKTVRWEADGD